MVRSQSRLTATILVLFFFFLVGPLAAEIDPNEGGSENPRILYYQLSDTIHGGTVEILQKIFSRAEEEGVEAVLIQLDTPGGLLNATEDIVKLFLNSNIPVVVYVAPSGARAGSAGTFITLAANVAAMAPGTYIGAAHPVMMFGGEKEGDQAQTMKKKIESATSSFIEAISKQRGRNKEWARRAVLESESITDDQALKMNVIDIVARSREELLDKIHDRSVTTAKGRLNLHTRGALIVPHEPGLRLRFLNILASPTVMYLLILGIIAGVYLEISHPGSFIPAGIAAVCLVLVLFATRTLPINALGIFLILAALVLLVAELYVTSYGVLTLGAIVCFFSGSLFLFDPGETDVRVPLSYIIGATAALGAIAVMIGTLVVKTFQRKQAAGVENLIGMEGVVEEAIEPGATGRVFVNSEYWNAFAGERIEKGKKIRVAQVRGLTVEVKII